MTRLNRNQKDKMVISIEGFLAAAAQPDRADLMAQLGITPSLLEGGAALVTRWHERLGTLQEARNKLEAASKAKKAARKVADLEMTSLTMLFRRLFYRDDRTLRLVGLNTKRKSQPVPADPNSQTNQNDQTNQTNQTSQTNSNQTNDTGDNTNQNQQQTKLMAVGMSHQESVRLMHWRQFLDNIPRLSAEVQAQVVMFGFDEARLGQIRQAVEAFAATIPARALAEAERKEWQRLFNLAEKELYNYLLGLRGMMDPKIRLLRTQGDERFLALMAV